MTLYDSSRALTKSALPFLNFSISNSSVQKDLVTRTPATEFSTTALTSPVLTLDSMNARLSFLRCASVDQMTNGRNRKIMMVSGTLMVQRMTKEPINIMPEMNTSSGP